MANANIENTKKKKASTRMHGCMPDKIDAGAMRAWIRDNGGGFPFNGAESDATPDQLAVAIYLHFQSDAQNPEAAELVGCDVCEGETPETFDACAFCGYGGEIVGGDAKPGLAKGPAAPHDVAVDPAKGAPAEVGGKKKKSKGADAPATPAVAGESETIMETQANGKSNGKGAGKLVKVTKGANGVATVQTLDKLVGEILIAKREGAEAYFIWAEKLVEIFDARLWRLRVEDGGKAQYATWDSFVVKELGMTPQHAENMMRHARNFSREERVELGKSKMTLLLQAPPAERKKLTEEVRSKKLSKREVDKKVKEARARTGYEGETRQQKAAAKSASGKKAAKKAAAKPKVTAIANLEGKKTIKLYQRPATIRNLDVTALKRASKIAQKPCGVIDLANDVRIFVEVKTGPDGSLQLSWEALRSE